MKFDFRFIVFRFMPEQRKKSGERKSTSVLLSSVLCTNKREPRFKTGADTNHIVGGGCIGGREEGRGAGQKDRGSWRRECCS